MSNLKKKTPRKPLFETIRELSQKKGVTVILDTDINSDIYKIGTPYAYEPKEKILTLLVNNFEGVNKDNLELLIKEWFNNGLLVLRTDTEKVFKSYSKYHNENPDIDTLKFFQDILSKDDFSALKLSLYLRNELKKGKYISSFKSDIRNKFGDRGANIANLCTSGYFESEFMPLYNKEGREEFDKYYKIVVEEKARALFVHSSMDINTEFEKILEKSIKYHMKDFRIHGLGSQNVSAINDFITKRQSQECNFTIKKRYEKYDPFVVVEYEVKIKYED